MRDRSALLAAINGVLLFANLVLLIKPLEHAFGSIGQITPGLATLIGSLLGLSAIAWQARMGFQNLIRSQEHRAKIEREARQHQAELQQEQLEHETRRERQVVAAAIQAELTAVLGSVHNVQHFMRMQIHIWKAVKESGIVRPAKLTYPTFKTPLFEANLEKLGLLGSSVASDVLQVYSVLRAAPESPVVENPDLSVMIAIGEGVLQGYSKLEGEIVHVGSRLGMVQGFRLEDPGSLYAFRRAPEGFKHDGYRLIARKEGDRVRPCSRR